MLSMDAAMPYMALVAHPTPMLQLALHCLPPRIVGQSELYRFLWPPSEVSQHRVRSLFFSIDERLDF